MISKDITKFGRHIVESLTNNDIPYTNTNKCKLFDLNYSFPKWALGRGTNPNNEILQHSHIIITWTAKPHKNSSIIWTNLKQIKTTDLKPLIESIKRDIKIESVLNEKTLDLI